MEVNTVEGNKSFEQSMEELELIVAKLESGNIPLEDMVELYERGAALGRSCAGLLEGYQARMDALATASEGE